MRKNYYIKSLLLIEMGFAFVLSSCRSYSEVGYLKNIEQVESQITENASANYRSRIMPDDMLSIIVSGEDPIAVQPFNLTLVSSFTPGETAVNSNVTIQSYLVDPDGYIQFPVLGPVKVGGMTKQECIAYLQKRISEHVENPIININFMNYHYSVLGEVNRPGTFYVNNERTSILDAISQAGDLTLYGQRTNVLLIREIDGKKQIYRYDLTDANILNSPYFYIKQNDVIYVEPNAPRKKSSTFSQRDSFNMSVISTIVSAVSVVTSLVIALLVK